jgi:Uncharacterized protein conserved in bacteria
MNKYAILFFLLFNFTNCIAEEKILNLIVQHNLTQLAKNERLYIAVHSQLTFGSELKPLQGIIINNTTELQQQIIFQLPKGDYAIAAFVDRNNNGVLDKNNLGYPKEPFALSNQVRPLFSAPTFKQCKIELSKTPSTVVLSIK